MSLFAGSAEELVFKATNNYQYDKVIYSVKIQHIYIYIYIYTDIHSINIYLAMY